MSHKWFDNYQDGVPHEIDFSEYNSIPDILEQSFENFCR